MHVEHWVQEVLLFNPEYNNCLCWLFKDVFINLRSKIRGGRPTTSRHGRYTSGKEIISNNDWVRVTERIYSKFRAFTFLKVGEKSLKINITLLIKCIFEKLSSLTMIRSKWLQLQSLRAFYSVWETSVGEIQNKCHF